eukprot:1034008-Amphidinium_carterae.3
MVTNHNPIPRGCAARSATPTTETETNPYRIVYSGSAGYEVYAAEDHNEYGRCAPEAARVQNTHDGVLWNNVDKTWQGLKQFICILLSILHFCNDLKRKPIQTTLQVIQRHEKDAQTMQTWASQLSATMSTDRSHLCTSLAPFTVSTDRSHLGTSTSDTTRSLYNMPHPRSRPMRKDDHKDSDYVVPVPAGPDWLDDADKVPFATQIEAKVVVRAARRASRYYEGPHRPQQERPGT